MGKSRKGKKAWRANISTKDVDDYVEKVAKEERSGGPLDAVSSDALFFVDKCGGSQLEKKTRKHEEKVLHCDSILTRNSLVAPLAEPLKRKSKQKQRVGLKYVKKGLHLQARVKENQCDAGFDIWNAEDKRNKRDKADGKVILKRKIENHSLLVTPAVEVDAPGSSYNPPFEEHQEALGLAVAQEMQKVYQKDLDPPPVPRVVLGTSIDDEEMYFLEVDNGDDWELDESEDVQNGSSLGSRCVKVKRRTRAELNKKAKRRAVLKVEEEHKKRASVHNDVHRLDEILNEIDIEDEEKKRKRIRRTIGKQEKLAKGPPRLGKIRFQPERVQVLLSSEVTGSLRKVKGCYTLLRERYKSLQRRAILEPRLPVKRKAQRKRVQYEEGSKGNMERRMHVEHAVNKQALDATLE